MARVAVLNAKQLVTLAGPKGPRTGKQMRDVGVIDRGAMIVEGDRIVSVGTTKEIEKQLTSEDEVCDATGCVVLPGFVDAHAHPVFGGDRVDEYAMRSSGATYEEIAAKGGGILSTVRKTREATEVELYIAGSRHEKWFVELGTTTVEAKSGYGLSTEEEIKMLKAIRRLSKETPLGFHPTFLGAHALPPEFDSLDAYVDVLVDETIPEVAKAGLAKWCDVFVEENYFTADHARRILGKAKEYGMGIRMHADQLTNNGGAILAAELGAKTADHLEQTDGKGIEAMKRAGVQPVLLPASVYCLGKSKYPDARAMIEGGLAVVLATDFNPGSSPTTSMPFVLSLASTQMKMSPEEALTAATINAAHSLDLGDEVGSLEPGKRADFAIWACCDFREIAYFIGVHRADEVFIAGKRVWSEC
jgi:imidazolonepropionase